LLNNCVLIQQFIIQTETNHITFSDVDSIIYCPTQSTVASQNGILCECQSPISIIVANPQFHVFAVATIDGIVAVYS
jgi:hypothetical protein